MCEVVGDDDLVDVFFVECVDVVDSFVVVDGFDDVFFDGVVLFLEVVVDGAVVSEVEVFEFVEETRFGEVGAFRHVFFVGVVGVGREFVVGGFFSEEGRERARDFLVVF